MSLQNALRGTLILLAMAGVLASCAGTPSPNFSVLDRRTIQEVAQYLNERPRLQADFDESGTDGQASGRLWLDRPGRLRVDYLSPSTRVLVANHGRLSMADLSTGASTTLPVASTPLGILLSDTVALSGAVRVTSVRRRSDVLQVSLIDTGSSAGGTLTLDFRETPLALIGVTVQDRSGRLSDYVLKDVTEPASIDEAKFEPPPVFAPAS